MSLISRVSEALGHDQWQTPSKEIIERMINENKSPDGLDLIQKVHHRLFVYDINTVSDESAILRETGADWCQAMTEKKFTLLKYTPIRDKKGEPIKRITRLSYPIPLEKQFSLPTGIDSFPFLPIRGRVFTVGANEIFQLDKLRDNGKMFIRKKVSIAIPYRKVLRRREEDPRGAYSKRGRRIVTMTGVIVEVLPCWMYVGIPSHWHNQIDGGFKFKAVRDFPIETPSKKLTRFYYWHKQELYDK